MTSELQPHIWLPEPMLSFHSDRGADRDIHPLRGLLRFGPHSAGLVPDPERIVENFAVEFEAVREAAGKVSRPKRPKPATHPDRAPRKGRAKPRARQSATS